MTSWIGLLTNLDFRFQRKPIFRTLTRSRINVSRAYVLVTNTAQIAPAHRVLEEPVHDHAGMQLTLGRKVAGFLALLSWFDLYDRTIWLRRGRRPASRTWDGIISGIPIGSDYWAIPVQSRRCNKSSCGTARSI